MVLTPTHTAPGPPALPASIANTALPPALPLSRPCAWIVVSMGQDGGLEGSSLWLLSLPQPH